MEEYVTRIGDVTIQRVIPGSAGPPVEPVRVMESEELLRAVKQEPLDDDEEEEEDEGEEEESPEIEDREACADVEQIRVKEEPRDVDDNEEADEAESRQSDGKEAEDGEEREEEEEEDNESGKRKADDDEDSESKAKKKKMENEMEADKKKISNLRRNIREVMDEAQLDEATLAAQRQEAERLRRVQDQQKYLREVQRQIQINKQNSKTQSRVISLLQGGSTSLLKTSAISSSNSSNNNSNIPSTVLVKLGSGQQQALNRKTLEVLRGGKTVTTTEPTRPGITRVTPGNRPAMVTPSVSIAPVKPIVPEGQKKDTCDTDVVTISSSSDSEDDCILISEGEAEEEEEEEDLDTTNSGMHTNDLYNIPDEQGRVLINVGKPESEPEIYLAPQIARIIKPHQIGGVRFLFDNVVESIDRFNTSTGFGCILAHSMGLGKTLQVVSFCDVFLRETSAKTVMCIMPINTLQNWMAEFNLWLPTDPSTSPLAVHGEIRPRNFGIYVLNDMHKTIAARAKVVEEWNRDGGVLLIGYEMYRQLSLKRPGRLRKGKKRPPDEDVEDEKNKPLLEAMHTALVRPGPDLVICDEGHRIKNSHASISHALKQIRTKRRVVLTGYPLQNNLLEYWCMVDFVRPNYLGTKTEFSNMFERPIQNGQCIDSTPQDIRLMRYRAHVLHSLLEGFVQRRSHSVLRNTLPQKEEYVILVRMTSFQRKLYDTFMNEVVRTKAVPNPLKAFAVCCKIWNHPDILYNFIKKKELDELQDLDIEETANLHTGPNSPRRPLAAKEKKGKTVKKAQVAAVKPEVAAPPLPQVATPEVKSEERKFVPPSSQSNPTGPPGYGDYYPPPPYPDLSYSYHRPPAPGMYYPGYYQDNPGYYPGYEGGYPGYFGNFGPYSGSKNEEYDKQSQSWGNNYGVNKEKNLSKSPKDFESSKPGYQEFYPIKEEKTEVKEEKQFLCGFSGGQVSYSYRGYSGYSEYPYQSQDYPSGWNKGTFPDFSQGEPPASGNVERTAPVVSTASGVSIVGEHKNVFSSSNQPEGLQKLNAGEDRAQGRSVSSQNVSHGMPERNQSNQNINETHSLHSSSDQQRLLSNREHLGGNPTLHSIHESMQANHMVVAGGQVSDGQQRRGNQDHANENQQGLFVNQRSDGNPETLSRNHDNLIRNRSSQETESNRMHTSNQMHSGQQSLLNTPDQLHRTRQSMFGNKNGPENEYKVPFNQEHFPGGQPMFSNLQGNKDFLASNQNSSRQNMSENSRLQVSQDHNLILPHNNFSSQRPEHTLHDERVAGVQSIHESQVRIPNSQDRISGVQTIYGSQETQKNPRNLQNVHDTQHRGTSSQDHLSATQQNIYGNQRSDHSMQTNHEHISATQQNMFSNLRNEHSVQVINQEQISNNHKSMFRNQRGEHGMQVNMDNLSSTAQNIYLNPRNEHNVQINQEHVKNNQQSIYGTHIGDHNLQCNPEHMSASHLNMCMSNRNENSGIPTSDHLVNTRQNLYGSQQRSEQNVQNNPEHMQQNVYNKQRGEHSLQPNSEQMSNAQQDMFRNQRSELNIQDNPENIPGSQQNMYSNRRADHGVQVSQGHMSFSHQNLVGNQTDQRRVYMGPENSMMGNQQTIFGGRNEHGPKTNQDHLQRSPSGNKEKDIQQRLISNQDRLSNNSQMFGNTRAELIPPSSSDHLLRHQEGFVRNQNVHEMDSKMCTQGLKSVTPQNIFVNQRVEHSVHSGPEQNSQQSIAGIQEKVNPDRYRFGNPDALQGIQHSMYRGQNIHDNQHKLHAQIHQQAIYGNQLSDHGIMGGQEQQTNTQTIGQQTHHQGAKRSSSGNDHLSLIQQQESYGNQGNDHSMQKIMKTDSQLENQQMVHSVQECSQFNMFSNSDGQYQHCNNQETIQNCRTDVGDSHNTQESPHRMHMNIERHLGKQTLSTQDQKHSNQNLFSNQNIHSSQRWLPHNNQELSGTQQNLFDSQGTSTGDDPFQVNQNLHGNKAIIEKQQNFHSALECSSISQQNIFMGQNNQISIQRQELIVGKQPKLQENQYRRSGSQDIHGQEHQQSALSAIERQQGIHNNQDHALHGSSQNVIGQKNSADQRTTQGVVSNPGIYGNQLQHNLQANQEYTINNQCSGVNIQNVPGSNPVNMHLSHQQGGSNISQTHGISGQRGGSIHNQELQKGNQNISACQNYELQNASQVLGGHEPHQGNQSGVITGQQSILNNQNISRSQRGIMNSQEVQQGSLNETVAGNHHGMYGNPYHIPSSQQGMQCIPNPPHYMQSAQQKVNNSSTNTPMFSNQSSVQGNSQIIGGGGQGLLGNQTHVQSSQQNSIPGPPTVSPLIHSKDASQGTQVLNNIPNFGSNHAQYKSVTSLQNVPVSSHSDHLQNSKLNINPNSNIPVSQHSTQHNAGGVPVTVPVSKSDQQKIQGSPQNVSYQNKMKPNQVLSVNQQGTQTGPDTSQMIGAQHRVQNMLSQTGMVTQQSHSSFDQTIIMSNKGMSGGQVMQGSHEQKPGMQNTQGNPEDQSRYKGQFDEQFMNDQSQGNFTKSGYFGQDYQNPYQNQFPYQENQFNEQPGPSGQKFRKEDDKSEEGVSKETDKNFQDSDEGIKTTSTSSTNTDKEEERDKKDKKDDDEKTEKKEGTSKPSKEDPGIPYDWATEFLKGYVPNDINASAKMAVFFCILEESIALGDRILVFSQSLFTLNLMEELLQQQLVPGKEEKWVRNVNYYRLDGSTTALEREKLINEFNSNSNLHLFLVSTRAGSLGINLVGANRVIVFDASWNPCHDTQAVCRVYRYGQKKPCFVYRLVTDNCLEKKIYDRQINKQGMSDRVVDECNPDAHLSIKEVTSLCWDDKTDDESPKDFSSLQDSYIDVVLQKVIQKHSSLLSKEPFQHESLLVDRKEKKLSQAEKRLAKRSYELEKQATTRPVYNGVQPNQGRPKPMASVRPMQAEMGQTRQRGWIPASVWQRQGMSAQEMTLPLDVVIPTNAADRASIVLKAGQKVMVLKSPKGIYMQLENGKIIAIRTAFKVGAKKPGEQQGKGGEIGRRGGRQQMISPRGRPVRAVGPVSRPPPVTVTVTRKRATEEEPAARREEDNSSTGPPPTVTVTPMDVSGAEKDVPNPFTAAAAASLSSMQLQQPSLPQQTHQPTSQVQHSQNTQPDSQQPAHPQQSVSQAQHHQQTVPESQHPQQPLQQSQHLQQSVPQSQNPQQPVPQSQNSQQPVPQSQYLQQPAPLAQHPQPSVSQAQHSLPQAHYLQQPPIQPSQHVQQPVQSLSQSQCPQQPMPQSQHPHQSLAQQIPHQQFTQQTLQHSRLSQQQLSQIQAQLPIVQPQQSHQPTIHSQPNHHQHLQSLSSQLPPQQLQQSIPQHQLPSQPIPPHSQILPPQTSHSQQTVSHSVPKQPISNPQLPQLPLHSMPRPQMQPHPIPPLSKMHQSLPHHSPIPPQSVPPHSPIPPPSMGHLQLPQPSLSQPQLPQQTMLHPQVQRPQHYEPSSIPPLMGDQLT